MKRINLAKLLRYLPGVTVTPAETGKRTYHGARRNRLTADWTAVSTSSNYELRTSLRILRARSRDLARNSSYVKKFLSMVRNNVVGPAGIKLQVRATDTKGKLDQELNKKVEAAFTEWSQPENASASSKLSWIDQQRLFMTHLARDGEVLVRMLEADNPFGFTLKFYDVNWLDETFNSSLTNGNRIIMSIEVDPLDRPVAYWFTPPPTEYPYRSSLIRERTRIPSEEIIHKFLVHDDECQVRGVPWGHTAMLDLQMLKGYSEAELIAARVGASKMGFLIPPAGDETGSDLDENGDEVKADQLMDNVEPGALSELPPGYDFKEFDPQHPSTNVGAFIKVILRAVASGLDVQYFSLANDLEGVNYSSARIGLLEERDVWRGLQFFEITHFCRIVFQRWLKAAIISGAVTNLRARDYDRLKDPLWRPRGWTWIDPSKEVDAHIKAIGYALESHSDVVAESGGNFDDLTTTIEHDQKVLSDKGITISAGKPGLADAAPPQPASGE
jgi:lambda family phage portal protein